jgi:hypothetical protein
MSGVTVWLILVAIIIAGGIVGCVIGWAIAWAVIKASGKHPIIGLVIAIIAVACLTAAGIGIVVAVGWA